ncbi:N(5)-(carboxyethyl)ornithine synthase [bacterium]|nr:N(5)-(carboxyethyl)ornithine synthase [bacterium]
MDLLNIGVIAKSLKENERRVPIHPGQLTWIPEEIRKHLTFEHGYGVPFGFNNSRLAGLCGRLADREQILKESDIVLISKPLLKDFQSIKENGIHWGWAHVVQQEDLAQVAIDNKLTLITWESMNTSTPSGRLSHIFYKNNEIAGYAGVMHALSLTGSDGHYGPRRKAVVIHFGSVSHGAIHALQGRGIHDIYVYVVNPIAMVINQVPGVFYRQIIKDDADQLYVQNPDGSEQPFIDDLSEADIIVNGIMQDTDNPLTFVHENEINRLKPGTLIIDISCDEGMGFSFAKPTTFENPMFMVGDLHYYAVDHTPSYLWNSASWEISKSLIPFIPTVMQGPEAWEKDDVIRQAIEIRSGIVQNEKILNFQKRAAEYPHEFRD